mgnify:FL=1|nr:DUF2683 family protein [uncultured Dyadobacter sp.]
METLVVKTGGKKLKALLSILEAMNIPFSSSEDALDKKIKQARKEKANGELITINPENVWESIK